MRKLFLLAVLILGGALPAAAQTTLVTGQVKDSNGVPYAGAAIKAGLVFAGTPVSNPTVTISVLAQCKANGFGSAPCQVPFNPSNGPFALDSGGNIPAGGITLQDNSLVTPSGTQWAITVNSQGNPPPLGTGPQTCTATLTISGASQSVSASFSACPSLSNSSGGISSPTTPSPTMGYYLSPACKDAGVTNAFCFNTPADTLQVNDCNWTAIANDVNCTASHFTSADVGKNAMGGASCVDDNQGNGTGGQIATTMAVTIASFISGTHITLSATPANAVASNGCFIYGHLDDASASAFWTALNASPTCPKAFMPASYYFFSSPPQFLWGNPVACTQIGPGFGNFGSTTLPAGYEVEGRGTGPTTVFVNTNFPNGDACTHKSFQTNGGCFAIPVMGSWHYFRIDGGAQHAAPNLAGKTILTMSVGNLDHFTCTNLGWLTSNIVGINLGGENQLDMVNNAGCGGIGLQTEAISFNVVRWSVIENSSLNAIFLNGASTLYCYWCDLAMPPSGISNAMTIRNSGGTLKLFSGGVSIANSGTSSAAGMTAYKCDASGGSLYAESIPIDGTSTGGSSGALNDSVSGCTTILIGSKITAGAGYVRADIAGATLTDLGGNTYSGSNGFNAAGTIVADGHQVKGACTGVATSSSTLGLYGTGPNVTASTCTSTNIGTGVVVNGARTLRGFACKSSANGTATAACTLLVNGALISPSVTCSLSGVTSCFDNTHTAALNDGDIVSIELITGATETVANVKASAFWF